MMLWFEILHGQNIVQRLPIWHEDWIGTIGRCSTCTIFLLGPFVAKHQLDFICRQSRYLDCCRRKRGYLTLVNDCEAANAFCPHDNNELQVGDFVLRFRAGGVKSHVPSSRES